MDFYEEYDPWCLFGTGDPLIDDLNMILSEKEIEALDSEWETGNEC